MAIIRKVFGPFHPEVAHAGSSIEEMHWHFFGIRGDRSMAHWTLVFDPRKRMYRVNNNSITNNLIGRSRKALHDEKVSSVLSDTLVHPNAWLDDSPVMSGTITSILKSKLSPEDIAQATALAIMRK